MKIGIVGLGNIAKKAYLPVYNQVDEDIEWILSSPHVDKVEKLSKQFHLGKTLSVAQDLQNLDWDAVMIHSATKVHYEQIKFFLENKINVYVDKPISENINQVIELYKLAEKNKVLLTVGFNRRFAPFHQQLKEINNKTEITVNKYLKADERATEFQAYDLFLHCIDTALYLSDETISNIQYSLKEDQKGNMKYARITFESGITQVIANLNLFSGTEYEEVTVVSANGIEKVYDLNTFEIYNDNHVIKKAPKWQPTLVTRGFDSIVKEFINAVKNNEKNPVSEESSILSHRLVSELLIEK